MPLSTNAGETTISALKIFSETAECRSFSVVGAVLEAFVQELAFNCYPELIRRRALTTNSYGPFHIDNRNKKGRNQPNDLL